MLLKFIYIYTYILFDSDSSTLDLFADISTGHRIGKSPKNLTTCQFRFCQFISWKLIASLEFVLHPQCNNDV